MFNIDTAATGTLTIKGIYTLTINYIDTAGTTVASPYVGNFVEGAQFGPIESPTVEGYTPNYTSVTGPEEGMPNRDMTVNVVYTAIVSETTVVTPVTEPVATPALTPAADDEDDDEGETPAATPAAQAASPETPAGTAAPAQLNPSPAAPIAAIPVAEADIEEARARDSVTINDEETPKGVIVLDENGNAEIVEIEDEETALAAGIGAAWALINLIATILSAVICIVLLVTWFRKKKEDEEEDEEDKEEKKSEEDEDEEEEKKTKRRTICRLASIIPAVASVIIFCLTENIKNPMILVDKWTLLMIVLLLVNIILAFFSKKKKKDEDDDEEEKDKKEQ
jgi:hypothetical protein